jgi:hypothetical protein
LQKFSINKILILHNKVPVSCIRSLVSGDSEKKISTFLISFIAGTILHIIGLECFRDVIAMSKILEKKTIFEVELIEPSQDDLRFVEANPDIAENVPDNSNQYSYRNQQAADNDPKSNLQNAPKVEGSHNSQKIIQGQSTDLLPIQSGYYQYKKGQENAQTSQQYVPRKNSSAQEFSNAQALNKPNFLHKDSTLFEDNGSGLVRLSKADQFLNSESKKNPRIDVYRHSLSSSTDLDSKSISTSNGRPSVRALPRTRPRLSPELLHGPLMATAGSAARRGTLAIDSTFSEFGEYQQQFYAAIQSGWYQEIDFFQPIDTAARVQIRFTLLANGSIKELETLYSSAGEIATIICENAISKRSPFRKWTQQMIQVFGNEKSMQLVFHYE